MVLIVKTTFFCLLSVFITSVQTSRVLELSDRFLDIHKDGQWLVMMYAPWCAHCKRLEPIWAHVAQHLHASSIRVGRIDCTRFSNVANTFQVKGFPTIIFFKGDHKVIYNGDKTRNEIVKFAWRMSGPAVQEVTKTTSFDTLKQERDLYFLYVGKRVGPFWDAYHKAADAYQAHAFFYQSYPEVTKHHVPAKDTPAVYVYKENVHYHFTGDENLDTLNETLNRWVNSERFPTFPKVTKGNMHQFYLTNKNLVLAVLEENELEEVEPFMVEFRDMVEAVIRNNREKYHDHFQFGWMGTPELIDSMAMMIVPVPSLIVINTTTTHHHIPDDEPDKLTPEVLELFLESIRNDSAPKYGGKGWLVRIGRTWFDVTTTIGAMWRGNPVLTLLLFGLPTGFLSLICYGICCPDLLDADDDEDDKDASHIKKD